MTDDEIVEEAARMVTAANPFIAGISMLRASCIDAGWSEAAADRLVLGLLDDLFGGQG